MKIGDLPTADALTGAEKLPMNQDGVTVLGTLSDVVALVGTSLPVGGTVGQVLAKVDGTNYNVQWTTPLDAATSATSVAVTGTTPTTVSSFAAAAYRSAKYQVQVVDGTNSQYHAVEIVVVHDGTTVFKTEYGEVTSAAALGTFDAAINGANVELQFTAFATTAKTVRVLRSALPV